MNLYDGNIALLGSIALMAAGTLVLGVGAYIAVALLWRLRHEAAPAELGTMLSRHGVDWGRIVAAGAVQDLALGLRRCTQCRERARCHEWLASGAREGYEDFCINAGFVERMKGAAQR
jgi:hypothetical protein